MSFYSLLLLFFSFRTPAIKRSILESSPRTPTPFKHALAAQEIKYGPLKMLVSSRKVLRFSGLRSVDKFPLIWKYPLFP
jgi:hypothetical protein